MFKIDKDGLAHSEDGSLVGIHINSFVNGLGIGEQSGVVILRLYSDKWEDAEGHVRPDRLHQFALPARRAAALGRALMEMAAQAEKELGKTAH